jgi:hypothetical protein
MTSPATKRARNVEFDREKPGRLRKALRAIVWFVAGAISGPLLFWSFARIVSGPQLDVYVIGMRGVSGRNAGCIDYQLQFGTPKSVEYGYVKIQFPSPITGYKVGLPGEGHSPVLGQTMMNAWELGWNASGQCDVIQAAVQDTLNMHVSVAGNMLRMDFSKLPSNSVISGIVATPEISPNSTTKYFEGSYEVSVFGLIIQRRLNFIDKGVSDMK